MNEAGIWLMIILGCVIFVPLVGYCLREYDFKRQISGKRPERKADKKQGIIEKQNMNLDNNTELIKEETKISGRNQLRWK